MTEPVVVRPLLRITQHGVRFGGLFEFLFGFVVPRIPVGVKLKRKFSIRAFDLLLARGPRNAKDLVIIQFSAQMYLFLH